MGAGRLFQCAVEVTESPSSVRPQSSAKKYTISAGDNAGAVHARLLKEGIEVDALQGNGEVVFDLANHDYFSSTPRHESIITLLRTIAAARAVGQTT